MSNNLKTPYFIINKEELDNGLQKLKRALDFSWPNYIIGYSYKTNALPWIIEYFKNNGCYAEIVSDDEYKLARSIGADGIIYNGIAKSKESFLEAVRKHSIVNIDAEYEIDWLDELRDTGFEVGIRVNFDLESMCPGQTQCGEDGERFGFCYENGELERAIEKIKSKGVRIAGLHMHKSSKTRMPEIYKSIADVTVLITNNYNLTLDYIDIGGGFFGGLESKPQFSEYFGIVSDILKKKFNPRDTKLIVEPGMALIGSVIDYYSLVLDVKKSTRGTFIITDGSRTQIDPLMTKNNYFFEIKRKDQQRGTIDRQIITGFTCMEHDRLFDLRDSEELLPGDLIIYHKVGAYTMCLSPLFIKWYPEVYVNDGERIIKVRDKWDTAGYKYRSIEE